MPIWGLAPKTKSFKNEVRFSIYQESTTIGGFREVTKYARAKSVQQMECGGNYGK
jgi:hypothetical protein